MAKKCWKKILVLFMAAALGFGAQEPLFCADSKPAETEAKPAEAKTDERTVIQTEEEAAKELLNKEEKTEEAAAENSQDEKKGKKKKEKKNSKKEKDKEEEKKDEKTVITIMNALKSGNKKDEKNGDDLLTFEGNVKISVEKNGSKTVISADKISYNRARDMLFAEGAVHLEQTESSGSTQSI